MKRMLSYHVTWLRPCTVKNNKAGGKYRTWCIDKLFVFGEDFKAILNILAEDEEICCFCAKSELDKSVAIAWVGSPAQSQMSLFLEYPFQRKSSVMSPKKRGRSSHAWHSFFWLVKIDGHLFRAQRVSKNKSICDCIGPQDSKVIDQHSYLIQSCSVLQTWPINYKKKASLIVCFPTNFKLVDHTLFFSLQCQMWKKKRISLLFSSMLLHLTTYASFVGLLSK